MVISGEHKSGDAKYKVLSVDPASSRATLEGITIKKHTKPTAKFPQGGIVDVPAKIHVSNLMLVDGSGKPTRVGYKIKDDGTKVRVAKKTGDEV